MKKVCIILLALLSICAFSCKIQNEEVYFKDNFNRKELEQKLALWKDLRIQNYEFTYEIAMETVFSRAIYPVYYTIKTSVKNGQSEIEVLKTNEDSPLRENNLQYFKTMEDAFDYVLKSHDYYAEDTETFKQISFNRLKYNKTYFYPETFYLDYDFRREFPEDCIIDTWMNPEFKIIDFKIIEE
ncbi:MAG: hypothetical protein K6E78_01510 [Treponema sp.]|nr:hypothetical protein [Treponema sp.]